MRPNPLATLLLVGLSCNGPSGDDTGEPGYQPDLFCPGSEGCATAEGQLWVGVATADITPTCFEDWVDMNDNQTYGKNSDQFLDCGCDRLCPGDDGYPGPDQYEGDGEFHRSYLAGFQNNRPAKGRRPAGTGLSNYDEGDGIYAKAVVFQQGESTLGLVTLDTVGWFYEPDTVDIRTMAAERGLDLDLVVVHATHNHEGPDTMGIWGPSVADTGVDADYQQSVKVQAVDALAEAIEGLTPVSAMIVGTVDSTGYSERGTRGIVNDTRDPYVVDERVQGARFVDGSGNTITTLVSFGNHPEALSDDNLYFSADYVHALRKSVEEGIDFETYDRDGVGGTTVFINSTVGGMMTPLRIDFIDFDGNVWGSSWGRADTIGSRIADIALDAVTTEGTEVTELPLSFRSKKYFLPVENLGFQAMFLQDVFVRGLHNYDDTMPIDDDNRPDVQTEVSVIEIGPLQLATVPGELLPEAAIGGYGGEHINTPDVPLVSPDNINPPPVDAAPEGPYLLDHFTHEYRWIVGLGNDQLGYIIPEWEWETNESVPYLLEAPGDHYEETNSLGPATAGIVTEEARQLLQWEP